MLLIIVNNKIKDLQVSILENQKTQDLSKFLHWLENSIKLKKNQKIIHFAKEIGFLTLIKLLKLQILT